MTIIRDIRTTLGENARTYLVLNITTFGVLAVALVLSLALPGLRAWGVESLMAFTSLPGLSAATDAYTSGNVVAAALQTFLVNLIFAAVLTTALPSLVIPFFAVAATIARAALIGVWLAPGSPEQALAMLPHAPIVIIEFQAYILASLGSIVLWRNTLGHRRLGFPSAGAGYRRGLRENLGLYLLVALILLLIAAFEAVEVVLIAPLLH